MFDEFDYFETPELDWNEVYGTPTAPELTGYEYADPSTVTNTPGTFNAAKDSQAANASENLPVNSDFTGGVNLVNGNPGVFDQLKNALGPDWMRTLLAGLTAAGAFRQPQTGAGALGAPRTRPGLSAFQMATSPGGLNFSVNGRGSNVAFAKGGLAQACQCLAEGGEAGPFVGYVTGPGGGQDDLIEARLSPGEYVFDADTVAALGDGNNEEGARRLDAMREQIRGHKREAPPTEIPPQAAPPEEYLSAAMQGGV